MIPSAGPDGVRSAELGRPMAVVLSTSTDMWR
jgi:hypothetical protein